ncbi:MAG TPA: hypothetical protein VFQ45_22555, partial [Longimicrobium sp.]|nr:hypothetical protein [Longimicrobium sp.]
MQPVFNFQGSAALSVLAFLGTGFLFAGAAGTALYLWLRGRRGPARLAGAGGMAVAGIYALALLGFSAAAREAEVPPGREKYFCEVDCHLAYAVL